MLHTIDFHLELHHLKGNTFNATTPLHPLLNLDKTMLRIATEETHKKKQTGGFLSTRTSVVWRCTVPLQRKNAVKFPSSCG